MASCELSVESSHVISSTFGRIDARDGNRTVSGATGDRRVDLKTDARPAQGMVSASNDVMGGEQPSPAYPVRFRSPLTARHVILAKSQVYALSQRCLVCSADRRIQQARRKTSVFSPLLSRC